jgi:hypothetical protein
LANYIAIIVANSDERLQYPRRVLFEAWEWGIGKKVATARQWLKPLSDT